MLNCKIVCPNCGKAIPHAILRLKSRHVCEKCGHVIMAEPKMVVHFLFGITLFFFAGVLYYILEAGSLPQALQFLILLIAVYALYFLLLYVLVKLFRAKRIYHITDHRENNGHF